MGSLTPCWNRNHW